MIVIDSNGFINRFRLSKKLSDLNVEKDFYKDEIKKTMASVNTMKDLHINKLPTKEKKLL